MIRATFYNYWSDCKGKAQVKMLSIVGLCFFPQNGFWVSIELLNFGVDIQIKFKRNKRKYAEH
jgi:hypothetical protein